MGTQTITIYDEINVEKCAIKRFGCDKYIPIILVFAFIQETAKNHQRQSTKNQNRNGLDNSIQI